MNSDILFLGRLFPRQHEKEIKSKMKTGMSDAANALQWNIINGLEENDCGCLRICNHLPVGSFPKNYKDLYVRKFKFGHRPGNETDINVGYLNLTIIKQYVEIIPFMKQVKKWAKDFSGNKKILFLYSAPLLSLKLAEYAKSIDNTIETVCVIADLPAFNTISYNNKFAEIYGNRKSNNCVGYLKFVDKFILLTSQMADKLNIKAPYMVMEGIAPSENVEIDSSTADKFSDCKYILYSGILSKKFGIETLLTAFSSIRDDELQLLICGCGECEEQIADFKDSRIHFLGKLDRSQVLALQRNAAVLVNPRQNNEEFTKYSFPSKTMEYLASGVPVVAYKLDGIPDEYDRYIRYVPDNGPEALAHTIKEVCDMPEDERHSMGEQAKDFVTKEKNYIKQGRRILDFINKE